MSRFSFIRGPFDGAESSTPALSRSVYLHVEVAHDDSSVEYVTGWVRPEVAALVKNAPKLLNMLKRIHAEYRILGDQELVKGIGDLIDRAEVAS